MQVSKQQQFISKFDETINDLIATRTLALNQTVLKELCDNYNVSEYYNYFIDNNIVPQVNTYHNNHHSFNVALNCYEGAVWQKATNLEIRCLLVAALFHDFRHTQGRQPDKFNISIAVEGFKHAQEAITSVKKLNDDEVALVLATIKITQYPWKLKKPVTLCEQIIRDADLMMVYEESIKRKECYLGLYNEMSWTEDMSIPSFCRKQLTFSSSFKWFTQWGKVKSMVHNYPKQIKDMIFHLIGQDLCGIDNR